MIDAGRRIGLTAALLAAAVAGAQPAPPRTGNADTLRAARDALVGAEDFSAALEPAESIVAATAAEQGQAPIDDVMRLARIQSELDMLEQAELNYLHAIERLRDADGEFSASLVPAYRALGRAYIHSGEFARALGVLEEARHVSQRVAGLYGVEQSDVIDDLTLAHLGLGNTAEARRLQLERLDNAVRRFGADDPRVVPFYDHLAEYYDRSRLRVSARKHYEQSLAVMESAYGELDPRLLPTLRAMLAIDFALGDVDEVPARIERILATHDRLAARERSESLAALGDWALIRGAPIEAETYYVQAYRALAEQDPTAAARVFAEPRMLDFVAPLSAVDRAARNRPYAWGTIELAFDVSADGRADGVTAVREEPPVRLGDDFVRRVQETHFRPRLIDGVPAATHGVKFAHDFRYYVARDDD